MAIHAYTSFSFSYLNRARVLGESLRKIHPDWVLWAVITDKPPQGLLFDIADEPYDKVVFADELFGDDTGPWLFGMDIVEACTAVKGKALLHIMDQANVDQVYYFDPDIAAFSEMSSIEDALRGQSIALTPHQIDPEPRSAKNAILDNEVSALQYGAFNLGFLAVNNDAEARRFAQWWDDRLRDWCYDQTEIGVFVDQKWCNLVPCFFDNVTILRDPGLNVASWNLSQRHITTSETGQLLVNDVPLKFYHFTKLGPVGDGMTRRYAGDNIDVYEIWWWYSQRVKHFTPPGVPDRWWYYGRFDNDIQIPKKAREIYRTRGDLRAHFPEPFRVVGDCYWNWLINEGVMAPDGSIKA
jgi:hypothetical protein